MKEPIIFKRGDCLEPDKALYWKDLLYRTVKVGTEIEFALPKGVRKEDLMPMLLEKLEPSGDFGNLGRLGVLDVVSEHCGVEIRVIGRQPYYSAMLQQYRSILSLLPEGVRARGTCGLHYHLLTVGLAEPVPEIILANIWNLTRRYAPELRFLTSTGDRMEALCRRRNYCSHLEMVRWTPGSNTMQQIQQQLRDSRPVPEHNNFLNLQHISFKSDGSIANLHYENRFPDSDLCPTSIVAKAFLFLAILLKAVDLSQYGVIHVGRVHEWRRKVELLDMLSNNDGPQATSDTSRITPEILDELRAGTRELLELLKPLFGRFAQASGKTNDEVPVYEVLSLLAENPISLLRCSGRGWLDIEALLQERATREDGGFDQGDFRLARLIELAVLTGRSAPEAWKWEAARELFLTPQELDKRLDKLGTRRGVRWDPGLGAMVFLG